MRWRNSGAATWKDGNMWGKWKDELERYDDEQRLIPEPIDVAKLERQAYERDFAEWEREQDELQSD